MIEKVNIVVLGVGGTIAATVNTKASEYYSAPSATIESILNKIPEIKEIANVECEQFSNIISHEIDNNFLITLANKIDFLTKQKNVAGVVITHGTNTIEETSYFLNLVINTNKPIILTGSMRPNNSLVFDGLSNLFNAIVLAADESSSGKGVLVTFNGAINNAREAVKNNVDTINNFGHFELGTLGNIQGNKPFFFRTPTTRHTINSEFNADILKDLPNVHIIYAYNGCDRTQVDAAINNDVKGVVCIGVGKGYFPNTMLSALIEARNKGIHVVRCSRVMGGIITRDPNLDDAYGFIAGGNLSPQKSRILLSLALLKTKNESDIQRMFYEY